MISIELVIPSQDKRFCVRADESITIGEFKKKIREFSGNKNNRIYLLTAQDIVTDDMTLTEAGLCNGSGGMIEIEHDRG